MARFEGPEPNSRIPKPQIALDKYVRSEKLQNESFPNFSNFRPEFCPEFCSEFSPNFSRTFRASFRGRRRPEKIHQKSPPFFNAKFPGKHEKNIHKILLGSRQSNKYIFWNLICKHSGQNGTKSFSTGCWRGTPEKCCKDCRKQCRGEEECREECREQCHRHLHCSWQSSQHFSGIPLQHPFPWPTARVTIARVSMQEFAKTVKLRQGNDQANHFGGRELRVVSAIPKRGRSKSSRTQKHANERKRVGTLRTWYYAEIPELPLDR